MQGRALRGRMAEMTGMAWFSPGAWDAAMCSTREKPASRGAAALRIRYRSSTDTRPQCDTCTQRVVRVKGLFMMCPSRGCCTKELGLFSCPLDCSVV